MFDFLEVLAVTRYHKDWLRGSPKATCSLTIFLQYGDCKIQPKAIDLSMRVWKITTGFIGFIP